MTTNVTAEFGGEDTATEVRVWSDDDGDPFVVRKDPDSGLWAPESFQYAENDFTPQSTWQDVLRNNGYGHLAR